MNYEFLLTAFVGTGMFICISNLYILVQNKKLLKAKKDEMKAWEQYKQALIDVCDYEY